MKKFKKQLDKLKELKNCKRLLQGGPTSALLWATFQNYSSLRASAG